MPEGQNCHGIAGVDPEALAEQPLGKALWRRSTDPTTSQHPAPPLAGYSGHPPSHGKGPLSPQASPQRHRCPGTGYIRWILLCSPLLFDITGSDLRGRRILLVRRRHPILIVPFVTLVLAAAALPWGAAEATPATFSGLAFIHIVGKTSDGTVIQASLSHVPYAVAVTPSTLTLSLPGLGITVGGPVASGHISISPSRASGGGTLGGSTPSQMGFVASSGGGEFQCLNAGFSAGFPFTLPGGTDVTIIQMDVHGVVSPGTYSAG